MIDGLLKQRARSKVFSSFCYRHWMDYVLKMVSLSSHLIDPLTTRGVRHHRWFRNQFPPFFPVLHCPLGVGKLQACPFPEVVFPPLPLSALSSSPFHCALQDGFDRPYEQETWPYYCSLHLFTMVRRSSCGPISCWILARTSSLVTWSLYEMLSILR